MRTFPHIAKLIKQARTQKGIKQEALNSVLGYKVSGHCKNGQFVSNLERSKCSIPFKKVKVLAKELDLDVTMVKEAILKDFVRNMDLEIEVDENS